MMASPLRRFYPRGKGCRRWGYSRPPSVPARCSGTCDCGVRVGDGFGDANTAEFLAKGRPLSEKKREQLRCGLNFVERSVDDDGLIFAHHDLIADARRARPLKAPRSRTELFVDIRPRP